MGDTILERNDINRRSSFDTLEDDQGSLYNSKYSDSSDDDNVIITIGDPLQNKSATDSKSNSEIPNKVTHGLEEGGHVAKSDSMIPMIGDSILEQNVTMDSQS